MSKKPVIVLVNRRALIARIDRALIKRGHELRIARRGGMTRQLHLPRRPRCSQSIG
jgi:hypothetical protein